MQGDLQRPEAKKSTTDGMLESPSNETGAGNISCLFSNSLGKGLLFLISNSCESISSMAELLVTALLAWLRVDLAMILPDFPGSPD